MAAPGRNKTAHAKTLEVTLNMIHDKNKMNNPRNKRWAPFDMESPYDG